MAGPPGPSASGPSASGASGAAVASGASGACGGSGRGGIRWISAFQELLARRGILLGWPTCFGPARLCLEHCENEESRWKE